MRKYMLRLVAAILAFAIGLATVHLSVRDLTRVFRLSPKVHSAANNSPYALREGSTIRLKPYDVTFEIPERWLAPASPRNLYLSWQELNYLYRNPDGDAEEAQVIDSVLSFENCAAHVGSSDWGNYLWNDLHVRVYVVELNSEQIEERVRKQGLNEAASVFENASLTSANHGEWQRRTLDVLDAPTHFILGKSIDFYYRPLGNRTVAVVFLHAGDYDETIEQILKSFRWPKRS